MGQKTYNKYGGPNLYGFVWTDATGMITANGYLKSLGINVDYSVYDIFTITPNAQTIAAWGGCTTNCLYRRVPSAPDSAGQ